MERYSGETDAPACRRCWARWNDGFIKGLMVAVAVAFATIAFCAAL